MKYALERMGDIVQMVICREALRDKSAIDEWTARSKNESANIRRHLLRRALSVKKKKELSLLVQQYQAEVIRMMDVLFCDYGKGLVSQEAEPVQNTGATHETAPLELYEVLMKELGNVLAYIEKRFAAYWNVEQSVPVIYLLATQEQLRERLFSARPVIEQWCEDEELARALFQPLISFGFKEEAVSYRELNYAAELVSALEARIKKPDIGAGCCQLIDLLIQENFNAGVFVSYLIRVIVKNVNEHDERSKKIDQLAVWMKIYSQAFCRKGVGFHTRLLPVKEQVVTWIAEEMHCLERKERQVSIAPAIEAIADEDKIHFSASVEVLSLLARLSFSIAQ